MALFTLGPLGAFRHRAAFREATVREIREIFRRGGRDVVFQIEVPAELVFVARMPAPLQRAMASFLARGVARLAREAPAGARFGIHLCLGDMNHRALGNMTDATPVVLLANAIVKAWPSGRPLEFVHAPFAAAQKVPRTDPAWYAPLTRLKLPGTTRFVAGFAHEDQDLEEQRRLRALIERNAGREVDVSTSCGLGRRTRPAALAALERTAALSADCLNRVSNLMKAVVHDRYGPPEVLRVADVERPVPKADEVLVKIHATTVSRTDTGLRSADLLASRFVTGLLRPKRKILGSDLAGEVEAVGAAVTEFEVGDHVFGINPWKFGAHAEFICMRANASLAHMPAGMTFEEAAAVCDGAILALNALRPADLRKGQQILIYGASGSIGTAGVQLARYFGADVTAVCNTKNFELVRSLGADEVIDYTQEDFTKNGQTYDVIFDSVGSQSFTQCRGSLKRGGSYVATDHLHNLVLALWTARFGDKRVLFPIPPRFTKQDVVFLKELSETGKYRAVIDRSYPMEQVVEATRYVETKQKVGNVVLMIS